MNKVTPAGKHDRCGCGKPATIRVDNGYFINYRCTECQKKKQ